MQPWERLMILKSSFRNMILGDFYLDKGIICHVGLCVIENMVGEIKDRCISFEINLIYQVLC